MTTPGAELLLEGFIEAWEPAEHPVHCANCRHARVHGDPLRPMVRCDRGHGREPFRLILMVRRSLPRQFRAAGRCEHFESMAVEAT